MEARSESSFLAANDFYAKLRSFTGTENYYVHSSGMRYTDGVKFLADEVEAYWLLDVIASWQPQALRDSWLREFQLWELIVHENGSATVACSRDTNDVAFRQPIPFTDFPLDGVRLYVEGGVILLPSEH
ncbi:MAG TPA: hypothetical protein VGJ81_05355 [Thermoanaerobaculia bacterium]|jgi:hypothetical protein